MTVPPIPDKPAFKAGEVCELAQIQPYVLRSWESEFPDLGLSKTPGGPRIYRRADVERVLRIRELVFTEGLTLSGVRRRFEAEQPPAADDVLTLAAELREAEAANGVPAPAPARTAVAVSPAPAAPAAVAAPALDDEARARLSKVKQDMRSLLELLETSGPPAPTPARRTRRA